MEVTAVKHNFRIKVGNVQLVLLVDLPLLSREYSR